MHHAAEDNPMYYDRTQPIIVQTNVSEYCFGASLVQNGWPIAFASKTLTYIKTHCNNMKQECFSLCFQIREIPQLHIWQACHSAE